MRRILRMAKTAVVLTIVFMMTVDTANACRLFSWLFAHRGACNVSAARACGVRLASMPASTPVYSAPVMSSAPLTSAPLGFSSMPIDVGYEGAVSYSSEVASNGCCCCGSTAVVGSYPVVDGAYDAGGYVDSGAMVDDGYVEGGYVDGGVMVDGGYADFPVENGEVIMDASPVDIAPMDSVIAPTPMDAGGDLAPEPAGGFDVTDPTVDTPADPPADNPLDAPVDPPGGDDLFGGDDEASADPPARGGDAFSIPDGDAVAPPDGDAFDAAGGEAPAGDPAGGGDAAPGAGLFDGDGDAAPDGGDDLFDGDGDAAPGGGDDLFDGDGDAAPAGGEDAFDAADDLFGQSSDANGETITASTQTPPVADEFVEPAATEAIAPATIEEAAPVEDPASDSELDDLFGNSRIPNGMRVWTDDTGTYETVGRLVVIAKTHVRLLKNNGRYSTVPLNRLSEADLDYVVAVAKRLTGSQRIASR